MLHQKPPQPTVLSKHPMLQEQPHPNTHCSKTCLVRANTPRHNRTTSKMECIRVNTTWNSMCYWHRQRRTPSFIQKRIQDMSAREPNNTNNAIIAPECIRSSLVRTNNTKIYNSEQKQTGKRHAAWTWKLQTQASSEPRAWKCMAARR